MASLFRVSGGIPGSVHHRGPWYFLTEEEAAAEVERDRYPELHPAAGPDIALSYHEVPLPNFVLPLLRRGPQAARGRYQDILITMWLLERRSGKRLVLTSLAKRLLEANPEATKPSAPSGA